MLLTRPHRHTGTCAPETLTRRNKVMTLSWPYTDLWWISTDSFVITLRICRDTWLSSQPFCLRFFQFDTCSSGLLTDRCHSAKYYDGATQQHKLFRRRKEHWEGTGFESWLGHKLADRFYSGPFRAFRVNVFVCYTNQMHLILCICFA